MRRALAAEVTAWVDAAVLAMPGASGATLRQRLVRRRVPTRPARVQLGRFASVRGWENIELADDVRIGDRCSFEASAGRLTIGAGSALNANVSLGADFGAITIGRDVLIGMNTVLRAADHSTADSPRVPIAAQGHVSGTIEVRDDVWIGANVVIVQGCVVGPHAVVAAGAVVTGDVPEGVIVGGVPARVIGRLGGEA